VVLEVFGRMVVSYGVARCFGVFWGEGGNRSIYNTSRMHPTPICSTALEVATWSLEAYLVSCIHHGSPSTRPLLLPLCCVMCVTQLVGPSGECTPTCPTANS
jgi:hypothetical protein